MIRDYRGAAKVAGVTFLALRWRTWFVELVLEVLERSAKWKTEKLANLQISSLWTSGAGQSE